MPPSPPPQPTLGTETEVENQRFAWQRRLAALDHAAAAKIRQLRVDGLSFDTALEALLATAEGAEMLDEYEWISDALDAKNCATESLSWLH